MAHTVGIGVQDFAHIYDPKKEASLEDTSRAALKQIDDKKYATTPLQKGIPEKRIRKYGFAFEGKHVLILC